MLTTVSYMKKCKVNILFLGDDWPGSMNGPQPYFKCYAVHMYNNILEDRSE